MCGDDILRIDCSKEEAHEDEDAGLAEHYILAERVDVRPFVYIMYGQ